MFPIVACYKCKHYFDAEHSKVNWACCKAFPRGIPLEIFREEVPHDKDHPYKGDHGFYFEEDENCFKV